MPTLSEIRIVCFLSGLGFMLINVTHNYSITDFRFLVLITLQIILSCVSFAIAVEETAYEERLNPPKNKAAPLRSP